MYYGRGYGRGSGMVRGGGMGFGLRGYSPPWPYVGIGRGGLPRCRAYGGYGWPTAGYWSSVADYPPRPSAFAWGPYGASFPPQNEARFLKDQAEMIRQDLETIDARLKELEKEMSKGGEP